MILLLDIVKSDRMRVDTIQCHTHLLTMTTNNDKNAILDGCSTVDSKLDYDGIGWYSMVFDGIAWYSMVFCY